MIDRSPIDERDQEVAITLAAQTVSGGDPARTATLEVKARRDPGFRSRLVAEARTIDRDTGRDDSGRTLELSRPARPQSRVEEVVGQMRAATGDPTMQVSDRHPHRNAPPPPSEIPPERDTRAWIEAFEDDREDEALANVLMSTEERAEVAAEQMGLVDTPELERRRARRGY